MKKFMILWNLMLLFSGILYQNHLFATVSLKIFMRDEAYSETNIAKPRIYLQNTGTENISNFYYYYYLTADNNTTPSVDVYYAPNSIVTLENLGNNNFRVKYSFSGFTLTPGSITPDINGNVIGLHNPDWSTINKFNDYSYTYTATFVETNKIPVYSSSGVLLLGSDPSSGTTQPPRPPVAELGNPPTISLYAVYGTDALSVGDRSIIKGGLVGSKRYVEIGCDAKIFGSLSSAGNAFLRDRSEVHGNVILGGTLTKQDSLSITGTTTENSTTSYPKIPLKTITIGTANMNIQNGITYQLPPGNYNDFHVYSNAMLKLNTGVYNFRTFVLEPDVHIIISAGATDIVEINARDQMQFADRLNIALSGSLTAINVRFYSNQQSQIRTGTDAVFSGIIYAPLAEVYIPSRTIFTGAIFGEKVTIDPDVTICRPATLSDLWHSEWAYAPYFDPFTLTYSAIVPLTTTQLLITPQTADPDATVTVNGQTPSIPIGISANQTTIPVNVTNNSQCGGTNYSLIVNRSANFVIYVNAHSPCVNNQCDGSSWNSAYHDLQKALDDAGQSGKEIWVAEGIYKPSKQTDITDPRTATFNIQAGTELIGGFKGTETQQKPLGSPYNTILSGDLEGNDTSFSTWPYSSATDSLKLTDNAYHVVTFSGIQGAKSMRLQGFRITHGFSNSIGEKGIGAGIFNFQCSPEISMCVIDSNCALLKGAGIYNGASPQALNQCLFQKNFVLNGSGGGMYNNLCKNMSVQGCIFSKNGAQSQNYLAQGGGIFNLKTQASLTNCILVNNKAANSGGGDCNDSSSLTITNCTIAKNISNSNGAGIENNNSVSTTSIVNSILWQNVNNIGTINDIGSVGFSATYSCFSTSTLGTGNVFGDPSFVNLNNPEGDDTRFGSFDDGLMLNLNSKCISTGQNSTFPLMDILNYQRMPGTNYDMGAYAFQRTNSNFLGKLENDNFIPTPAFPVFTDLSNKDNVNSAMIQGFGRVIQLEVPNNKYTQGKTIIVIIQTLTTAGIPSSPQKTITLYRVGSSQIFRSLVFQSGSILGKNLLFSSNSMDVADFTYAYVLKALPGDQISVTVPRSQFN